MTVAVDRRPRRVVLVGFGNVGRELAAILVDPSPYPGLHGLNVQVVAVTTASRGTIAMPEGVDLLAALRDIRTTGAFAAAHRVPSSTLDILASLDYDVMVELSPLSVPNRGEPAISHVRSALERGKHVVTANKGPLAWAYRPLRDLARQRGCAFLHEATVMDGAPVFSLARHCLRGTSILRLEGILNSTTNFVLDSLEKGGTVEDAVRRAQQAGFAEADPSLDLDGWDAAVKVTALANVLMDADLRPETVPRERMTHVDPARVREAPRHGRRVKIVAEAVRDGEQARARVESRELALDHPFAIARGTTSVLRITTDLLGTISLTEESPDLRTTAYGVLADLLALPA
jgi:homoserine dehydrogenase